MWIDITVIAIIALFTLVGIINGFAKTLFSFSGFFVSIVLAAFLTGPIYSLLEPTSLFVSISNAMSNGLGVIATVISTEMILKSILFVLLFVIILIVLMILKNIFTSLTKLHILGVIDRLLGSILGFAFGLITVYVFFYILSLLSDLQFLAPVFDQISTSIVGKFFYDNNLIVILVNNVFSVELIKIIDKTKIVISAWF